jgi:endonuclease YncB( thermonuclease family)
MIAPGCVNGQGARWAAASSTRDVRRRWGADAKPKEKAIDIAAAPTSACRPKASRAAIGTRSAPRRRDVALGHAHVSHFATRGLKSPRRSATIRTVKRLLSLLLLAVLLLSALLVAVLDRTSPEREASFHPQFRAGGAVRRVIDGDSFVLDSVERGEFRVRLHAVDAPESTQAYAAESKRALEELLRGRSVEVECYKTDARGREVCRVYAGSIDVGRELVLRGAAWHYDRYADEQTFDERRELARLEARARRENVGLWAAGDAMPPWECRARLRELKGCR